MAITVEQQIQRIDALIQGWQNEYVPLFFAVSEIRGIMSERIFGGKSSEGKNTAGVTLPSVPYSTKPIYVDVRALPNKPTSFQIGKKGKKIKSAYFPQGYSQLKEVVGVPPLELTNQLDIAFTNTPTLPQGQNISIVVPDSEAGKIKGLEKKYGTIFQMSVEEENEFSVILSELLANAINKALE